MSGLSPKQYVVTQMCLMEIGKRAKALNIKGLLESIAVIETKAPKLDTETYRRAMANLDSIKQLAFAVEQIAIAYTRVEKAVEETSMAYMLEQEKKKDYQKPPEDTL